jgi:hypothetical protein
MVISLGVGGEVGWGVKENRSDRVSGSREGQLPVCRIRRSRVESELEFVKDDMGEKREWEYIAGWGL